MSEIVNLVVVAHPDDEILGFGGAGSKFTGRGEIVQPIMISGKVDIRTQRPTDSELAHDIQAANTIVGFNTPILGDFPNIRLNTVPHIELVQFIERQIEIFNPDRIFTHHPGDLNDDHGQVAKACFAAARLFQRRAGVKALRSLHCIEIPSSTDWSFPEVCQNFRPNEYVGIDETLELKLKALTCYRRIMRPFPHPRSAEVLSGLAAIRGGESGLGYAEAFQTIFSTQLNYLSF